MVVKTQRQIAFDVLKKVYKDKGYSNLTLEKTLENVKDSRNYITALVYGVIERNITLEYIINKYSKKPCNKLDIEVAIILKIGVYELLYMDSVPENASVNESVNLCQYCRKTSAKGLVNAILRAFIRDGSVLKINEKDDIKSLSIAYSCPVWLIKKWVKDYSYEDTKAILKASIGRPPVTIRVNTLKTTKESLKKALEKKQIKVQDNEYIDNCLSIANFGSLEKLEEFTKGLFYVQDLASQFCAMIVGAKENEIVYDLCSAPGSKSFTMAQYMNNKGKIKAFDLYEHKLKLIYKTAQKLGIDNITTAIGDASKLNSELEKADRVLCDVPCAGLGIIRRKPEIKYKSEKEINALPLIQYSILQNAKNYVKDGGVLVYSTCSLNKDENEKIVAKFLAENTDFEKLAMPKKVSDLVSVTENTATFMPHHINSDGFFIATFSKVQNTK